MGSKEITRVKGDTHPAYVFIRRDGAAYDLTGATVTMYLNKNLPLKTGDVPLSMQADASTSNKATFNITPDVANLEPGDYYAQVRVLAVDGTVWTAVKQHRWRVTPSLA